MKNQQIKKAFGNEGFLYYTVIQSRQNSPSPFGVVLSSQLPFVKSGKSCGVPPRATDCSESTVTAIHDAQS